MTVQISPLGTDDDAAAHVHRIRCAALAHDLPDLPLPSTRAVRKELRHDWPGTRTVRLLAADATGPVGLAVVDLPQRENTHLADVDLTVIPARRRRGVGRALYAAAVEVAREHGRRVLQGGSLDDPTGPGRGHGEFAVAMGAKPGLAEARRRMDLDTVDRSVWTRLREEAEAHADGYRMVRWTDAAPDDLVADVAALDSRVILDIPIGDLLIEPEHIDVGRARETEAAILARGRRSYHAGAQHVASGRLVAWTLITFDADVVEQCWQQITIVDPEHRGHRLGQLVKLENLAHALGHEPAVRHVDTFNAHANSHMIAINEALGFRVVDRWLVWQAEL